MDTTDRDLALEVAKGDAAAAEFMLQMCRVMHLWDDLIDKDKAVSDAQINEAFQLALVDIPRNPFYARHFVALNAHVQTAITNWHVATRMEREGGDYEKSIAFILRSSYMDLFTQVAQIVGGPEWAVEMAHKTRLLTHKETYAGYLMNLEREAIGRLAREGGA